MATLIIEIPDGSPELEELLICVAEAQVSIPGITATEYVSNLVIGYARNRVINIYKNYAGNLSLAELKNKLGTLSEVRKG